ncbi:hypothetical protein [Halalkalibacter akibai]|uniref:Lipoprotein n=1 Tax=Halalkalibacter akibai (strain ATCC 43226 / DSM 21942 / CIP 109018 / JCM 9157 / 1139) TaxID=1236973 RepID=W4R000_HALA3|nr:hypothetical protein [Halalkalibacter akibai]GAE37462.1 hypothetical protein JCM9157_4764 [Halalkalibacter akibai JCM 9157]
MIKKLLFVLLISVILGVSGCWKNDNKLDTSLLKTIGENSYVFPAYEVILGEMPFKTQLPTYIPFKGTTASKLWETSSIITNNNLEEVSVQLSVQTFLPEDGPEALLVVASNYKDESWENTILGKEVQLSSGLFSKFSYGSNTEDDYVDLRFNNEGIYYILIYYNEVQTIEEKEKELIKIANSLVDYDKWYDKTYLSNKQ